MQVLNNDNLWSGHPESFADSTEKLKILTDLDTTQFDCSVVIC